MTKYRNLREIFENYIDVKVDKSFMDKVIKFKNNFYSKNAEHIAFFTGVYFGVHIPKWTNYDDDWWIVDLLECDEDELSDHILDLPSINKDWSVSSNTLSITFIYLMYLANNTKYLGTKDKEELKIALMEVLIARYISSSMNHYFSKGPTTPEIAKETYERLSKRFTLKAEGSWMKLIRRRAETYSHGEDVSGRAIYSRQEVFETFEDNLVVRKLNSVKSATNDTIQEINAKFREVLEDKKVTKVTSVQSMGDDGLYVKDLIRQTSVLLSYQDQVFSDKNSFFKSDLKEVIVQSMPTISENILDIALEWMYDNQNQKKYKSKIDDFRHSILVYSLNMLEEEGIKQTDLVNVAYRIRQNFASGRANDPELVKCRKLADTFIITARPKSKGKLITMERIAIMMYFVLRTLAKNHYS